MSRLTLVNNAEEIAVRILKDDEIVIWFIGLEMTCSSYLEQPFHFIFLVVGVKVEVYSVSAHEFL
jgi:hypothetical protein